MSTPPPTGIVDERLAKRAGAPATAVPSASAATSTSPAAASEANCDVFVSFPHPPPSPLVAPRLVLPAPAETQTQTQTPARYVAGRVRVDGMTCDACVNSILRVLTDKYGLVDGAPGTFRPRASFGFRSPFSLFLSLSFLVLFCLAFWILVCSCLMRYLFSICLCDFLNATFPRPLVQYAFDYEVRMGF